MKKIEKLNVQDLLKYEKTVFVEEPHSKFYKFFNGKSYKKEKQKVEEGFIPFENLGLLMGRMYDKINEIIDALNEEKK